MRNFWIGFALIAGGIMAANLLAYLVTPNARLVFPLWVVLCLIPAYWHGHRIGIVTYAPWEVLGTIAVVLAAVILFELWSIIRPLSALTLALLVCLLFLARRRWLANGRKKT
jgi:hypothetical protein